MPSTVFVVDDMDHIRKDLYTQLSKEGYNVIVASSSAEATTIIKNHSIDYAIVDLKYDSTDDLGGLEVIAALHRYQPRARTIILSAYLSEEYVVKSMSQFAVEGSIAKGGADNYIVSVINELHRLRKSARFNQCFVIMPFSDTHSCTEVEWNDIFDNTIRPAVMEAGLSYECSRASLAVGNIIRDILDNINRADVVIADMTDRNPNVFYELGVRHALRDITILITQNINDVPFDLRHYAIIQYEWKTKRGRDAFKGKVRDVLAQIETGSSKYDVMSPVREYLKRSSRE